MSGNETDGQPTEEEGSFWDNFSLENFSLDGLNPSLLWQIPLIGGGLWFLGSMFFGERRNPNQDSMGPWLNLGIFGAIGTAIWYFFMRTPGREEMLEDIAELNVNPQGLDHNYSGAGQRAYEQAFQVEFSRFMQGNESAADSSLSSAIEILQHAKVHPVPEDQLARADATVDAALRAMAIQQQQDNQPQMLV